ncbi:MAG TPA: hypothetical protein PK528_09670 [Syntrophorhabdus sp.]|nr:hypothetical protein [Syntrophorhabdus sp.]
MILRIKKMDNMENRLLEVYDSGKYLGAGKDSIHKRIDRHGMVTHPVHAGREGGR